MIDEEPKSDPKLKLSRDPSGSNVDDGLKWSPFLLHQQPWNVLQANAGKPGT
jgi:hypothetical protein